MQSSSRECESIPIGDLLRLKTVQLSLALVAAGSIEGVITNVETHPWDTVSGVYLIEQAGGTVTDLDGDDWRHDCRGLVASNGQAHEDVLAAAKAIDPPAGEGPCDRSTQQ